MLDRGLALEVEAILATTPRERQTVLFSATIPAWVATTASKHLRDPQMVAVDAGVNTPPEIEHIVYEMDKASKMEALRTFLDRREGPILVFGRTKHGVEKLAAHLVGLGYPVDAIQGNLRQSARERVMERFRSGKVPILVATNVAARGLDFQGIDQVINFDLPDSGQLFTHRAGRTGRMGRRGEAITFITTDDFKKWREIERTLGRRFPRQRWPGSSSRSGRPMQIGRGQTPWEGSGRAHPRHPTRNDARRTNGSRVPGGRHQPGVSQSRSGTGE
jgi:ATP-dependent RNA helicase DeaD